MLKKTTPLLFIWLCFGFKNLSAQGPCNISFTDTAVLSCSAQGQVDFTTTVLSSNGAVSFVWDFGDNSSQSLQSNPQHLYDSIITYNYQVIGTDTSGCSDTISESIALDSIPVSDFGATNHFSSCPPFPAQFVNQSAGAAKYAWQFGDGDTSIAANPLHVYFFPGNYSVTLIAYNNAGCTDTSLYSSLITINGPIGQFTVNKDSGAAPLTVHFWGIFPGDTVQFDGSTFSDSLNALYTFNSSGTFHPVFTLKDPLGCSVAYSVGSIIVTPGIESISGIRDFFTQLYPNPASDRFVISTNSVDLSKAGVLFFDNLGRKIKPVYYINNNKIYFNIRDLSPGIYTVCTDVDGNTIRQKIIKE